MQPRTSGLEIGRTRRTKNGYPDVLFRSERKRIRALKLRKLGCGGETALTLTEGGICEYDENDPAGGSQLKAAEHLLKRRRGHIAFLTIDIGGNDLEPCAAGGVADYACVGRGLQALDRYLPRIARRLRRAAGDDVRMAAMTYHDPVLQSWLNGTDSGRTLAELSVGVIRMINDKITKHFSEQGFEIADVATDQKVYVPFSQTEELPPYGQVPVAVAETCRLTWMCAPRPLGPNIHHNDEGHRRIAAVFRRAIR